MIIAPAGIMRCNVGGGTAGFGPYFPLSLPNLELYLDSRIGISAADGAAFAPWLDQSTNARDAIAAGGSFLNPVYHSASSLTPKGKATVEWGTATAFPGNALGSASFGWPLIGTRGYTTYWYGKPIAKTAAPYPFINQTAWNRGNANQSVGLLLDDGSGGVGIQDDNGGGAPHVFSSLSTVGGGWHVFTSVFPVPDNNTVPCRFYVDGALKSQVSGPTNYVSSLAGNDSYILGNAGNGNTVVRGFQGFFLWYSDTHSLATINQVKTWAGIYFGF